MKICLCGMVLTDDNVLCHNCGRDKFEPLLSKNLNLCYCGKILPDSTKLCSWCAEEEDED